MKFNEIRRELELESDLVNLSHPELDTIYGIDVRRSIVLLNKMANLFKYNPFYRATDGELINKLGQAAAEIKDCNSVQLVTSRADSIIAKVQKTKEAIAPEEGYYEGLLLDYNHALGVGALNCPIWSYEEIALTLSNAARKLEELGSKYDKMPELKDVRKAFKEIRDNRKKKYVCLSGEGNKVDDIYRRFPLMHLCFDTDFLLLTNYLLQSASLEKEDKLNLIDLANKVMEMSDNIEPFERIHGEVDMEEYRRLEHFTMKNMVQFMKAETKKESITGRVKKYFNERRAKKNSEE